MAKESGHPCLICLQHTQQTAVQRYYEALGFQTDWEQEEYLAGSDMENPRLISR